MKRPRRHNGVTVLEMTGDDDALTYGGGVIFRKDDEVFWQFWDPPTTKTYLLWTARIGRNVLRDYKSVDRDALSRAMGLPIDTIRSMTASTRVMDRHLLIQAIGELEGRSHICPLGPEELTAWEMGKRWGGLLGFDPESFAQFDAEDYMVCEYDEGHACGQIDGRFVGVYDGFKGCLAAIAEDMESHQERASVFVEGKRGRLEKLEWNRSKWLGQPKTRIRVGFGKSTWGYRMRPFAREAAKKGRKLGRVEKAVKRGFRGTIRKTRT